MSIYFTNYLKELKSQQLVNICDNIIYAKKLVLNLILMEYRLGLLLKIENEFYIIRAFL